MCLVSAASPRSQTSQTSPVLPPSTSTVSRYEMIARLSGDECAFSNSGEGGREGGRKQHQENGGSKRGVGIGGLVVDFCCLEAEMEKYVSKDNWSRKT